MSDTEEQIYVVKRSFRAPSAGRAGRNGDEKDYHLTLVSNQHRALLIRRYGKKGKFGRLDVDQWTSAPAAVQAFEDLVKEKHQRGPYKKEFINASEGPFTQIQEVLPQIGLTVWPQIGAENAHFMFGENANAYTFKDAENPEFYEREDGSWGRKEKPLNVIPDPEPTLQDRVKSNPNWGMF